MALLPPLLLAVPAGAVDLRAERARKVRDEILAKRGTMLPPAKVRAPAQPKVDPFQAAVDAARSRVALVDGQIEERRRSSEAQAGPREKLAARSEELAAEKARLVEADRARVEAIYRGAQLGAAAAGWNPDQAKSRRLSRYLAAVAGAQRPLLERAELEQGSVLAALDKARTEEASLAGELRVLETERSEAQAALDRAIEEAKLPAAVPEGEAAADDADADSEVVDAAADDAAQAAEEAAPAESGSTPTESEEEIQRRMAEAKSRLHAASGLPAAGADAEGGDFHWFGTAPGEPAPPPGVPAVPGQSAATPPPEDRAAGSAPSGQLAAERLALARKALDERRNGGSGSAEGAPPSAAAAPGPAAEAAASPPAAEAPAAAAPVPAAEAPAPKKGLLSRLFGENGDSDKFAAAHGTLPPPVAGKVVAAYGQQHKSGATYQGVILRAQHDAPIRAVAAGRVSFVGNVPGLGNTVIVSHGSRYHTVYGRLGNVRVKEGDAVSGGSEVGELPDDNSDMHFELRDNGKPIDPLPWLKGGIPGAAP